MCSYCDDPTMTPERERAWLTATIAEFGWAVQGVERERDRPPWAYTVGLTAHARPELLVTGLALPAAQELLNDMAAHLLHAATPAAGQQVPLIGGPVIEYVRVAHPEVHLTRAVGLFGPDVAALQVVWADDRGHWPWDVGFRARRGGQPVLGTRARATDADDSSSGA